MAYKLISVVALLVLIGLGAFIAPAAAASVAPMDVEDAGLVLQTDTAAAPQAQDDGGSSLPEGLSKIFASLGLYIVTMFTMAIGTEITVDVFKLAAGFKSKPTAAKTLDEYEKVLPGTLESLGLGAEAQYNLETQLANMKNILAPVFKAEQVIADLKTENFSAALEAVTGTADPTDSVIAHAAAVAKQQIQAALGKIQTDSVLGLAVTKTVREKIDAVVDALAETATDVTPEEMYQQAMVAVNGELATAVTTWTETQIKNLQQVSYESAAKIIETRLLPQVANSGLNPETEAKIKQQLDNFLQNIQTSRHADIYLETLNKLLQEVERQRDELRSHWRKWYWDIVGWLRQYKLFSWLPERKPKLDPTIKDASEAAGKLLEIERRDKREASSRIQQMRLSSVFVGVILAYFLQIDSADLLRDLFPQNANFLSMALIPHDATFFAWVGSKLHITMYDLSAGVILTGLAASAGSGFWHDQLSRLQSVKKGAEAAYTAIQSIQK